LKSSDHQNISQFTT